MGDSYHHEHMKYFADHRNGYAMLKILYPLSLGMVHFFDDEWRWQLIILGTIVGLSLIQGVAFEPLNPVLLHWLLNDCKLGAISPSILEAFHPNLKLLLMDWNDYGPEGDITRFEAHFATYHDLQVSSTLYLHYQLSKLTLSSRWLCCRDKTRPPMMLKVPICCKELLLDQRVTLILK